MVDAAIRCHRRALPYDKEGVAVHELVRGRAQGRGRALIIFLEACSCSSFSGHGLFRGRGRAAVLACWLAARVGMLRDPRRAGQPLLFTGSGGAAQGARASARTPRLPRPRPPMKRDLRPPAPPCPTWPPPTLPPPPAPRPSCTRGRASVTRPPTTTSSTWTGLTRRGSAGRTRWRRSPSWQSTTRWERKFGFLCKGLESFLFCGGQVRGLQEWLGRGGVWGGCFETPGVRGSPQTRSCPPDAHALTYLLPHPPAHPSNTLHPLSSPGQGRAGAGGALLHAPAGLWGRQQGEGQGQVRGRGRLAPAGWVSAAAAPLPPAPLATSHLSLPTTQRNPACVCWEAEGSTSPSPPPSCPLRRAAPPSDTRSLLCPTPLRDALPPPPLLCSLREIRSLKARGGGVLTPGGGLVRPDDYSPARSPGSDMGLSPGF